MAGVTTRTAPASEALVRQRVGRLVQDGRSRVLVLRATPRWTGPPELDVGGARVLVRAAVSQLAALDALVDLGPDDYLVLLTDRPDDDLGDTILLRAYRQRVEQADEWGAIPSLFGAHTLDPELRRAGSWVPAALLDHTPPGGWPHVPSGNLSLDAALSALLARILRLPLPAVLDDLAVLEALDRPESRAGWQAADDTLRTELLAWSAQGLGPVAALALAAAEGPGSVSVVAVGLAVDVLWPGGPGDEPVADQIAARARIEARLSGKPVRPRDARLFADAARGVVARLEAADDGSRFNLVQQSEALLADVGWADGAARSETLPAGFTARLRELAAVIAGAQTGQARSAALEGALRDLLQHQLERRKGDEVRAARMAVRLERWLATPDQRTSGLGDALDRQISDGAWVDRAAAAVWAGSSDPQVSEAYRGLHARVARRRAAADQRAAGFLAESTARDAVPGGVLPVEDLLARVVAPLVAQTPVLLVVLDGMSASVATAIVDDAVAAGWVEHVEHGTGRRTAALSVLPSVTTFSRTSLFAGRLLVGTQDAEKREFRASFGGPVFHKDDLRAPAGQRLPDALEKALRDPQAKAVGVVLNTIDDALAKHDPGGTWWDLAAVQHLRELLDAAARAGRTVVLTSDHGHVVERGGEARPVNGADARWRPTASGEPGEGEVLVRGRRVLAPGGAAVLPWREDLRYGAKRAGYHGGASLAEITIPVVVLAHTADALLPGWVPAAPQAPGWWNDPPAPAAQPAPGGRRAARRTGGEASIDVVAPPGEPLRQARPVPAGQGVLELGLEGELEAARKPRAAAAAAVPEVAVVDALLASEVYASQRARAGRRALDDGRVRLLVGELVRRGGRAHRDTLGALAGVPTPSLGPTLAALFRLLNVDGYPVAATDPDGATVIVDVDLLREQFELGDTRA